MLYGLGYSILPDVLFKTDIAEHNFFFTILKSVINLEHKHIFNISFFYTI